ncbi:hypothetical protein AB0B88_16305 [Micromonospora haikouensis]|uniref:hypothetical protein n=1 Tax=Micromonospora haikouensis TaxID=686309 RepID=UPI00340E5A7D
MSSPRTIAAAGRTDRTYVLFLGRSTALDPITGVTDDAGNTWTRLDYAPKSGSTGRRAEVWSCRPAAPFTVVSVAFTGSGVCLGALLEVAGAAGPDVSAADVRSNSGAPAPVTVAPTVGGGIALAAIVATPTPTSQITPSAGWTLVATDSGGPAVAYRPDPPAGTPVGVSWTLSTATGSGHAITVVKAAPVVPAVTVTVWDGAAEQPATLAGVWDGATVQPATLT